jgi:hypothetical protein
MKKYIVSKKIITDEFVFIRAKNQKEAKTLVLDGEGKNQGTQYAGQLPASCWEVTELTEEDRKDRTHETF